MCSPSSSDSPSNKSTMDMILKKRQIIHFLKPEPLRYVVAFAFSIPPPKKKQLHLVGNLTLLSGLKLNEARIMMIKFLQTFSILKIIAFFNPWSSWMEPRENLKNMEVANRWYTWRKILLSTYIKILKTEMSTRCLQKVLACCRSLPFKDSLLELAELRIRIHSLAVTLSRIRSLI